MGIFLIFVTKKYEVHALVLLPSPAFSQECREDLQNELLFAGIRDARTPLFPQFPFRVQACRRAWLLQVEPVVFAVQCQVYKEVK